MPASSPPNPCYLPSVYRRVVGRDRELYQRHLAGFVPTEAFDAHAHLYTVPGLNVGIEMSPDDASAEQTLVAYQESVTSWMGEEAPREGLFFAMPLSAQVDVDGENRFVAEQVRAHAGSRALMLIRPTDDPATVESEVAARGFCGFKPYHLLDSPRPRPNEGARNTTNSNKSAVVSADAGTFEVGVGAFLPEWTWELADQHGLALTLHMVRQRALSDPGNQEYLRDHCLRHPGARLILAHAARGFCAQHTLDGIDVLRGLGNVFFDTSAICEPTALEAILRAFGPSRVMFGTDSPVCNLRGKAVSVAEGFFWMYEHNVDWEDSPFAQPTLVGIESLLALRRAACACALTDDDLEQLFCRTARQALGIDTGTHVGAAQEHPGVEQLRDVSAGRSAGGGGRRRCMRRRSDSSPVAPSFSASAPSSSRRGGGRRTSGRRGGAK